jgi:hypothetical protein
MKELLLACPLCHQPNFTTRGLRQHWCPTKPPPPGKVKHSAPLTRDEWLTAVDDARRLAGQTKSKPSSDRALFKKGRAKS